MTTLWITVSKDSVFDFNVNSTERVLELGIAMNMGRDTNNPLIAELKRIEEENKHSLRHLMSLSCSLGLDFTSWAVYKDYMKILNMILLGMCFMGILGQCGFVWQNMDQKFSVFTEASCLALQTISGLVELFMLLTIPHNLEKIFKTTQKGDILSTVEIFEWDIQIKQRLLTETCDILEASWRNVRLQVRFLLSSVLAICNWYWIGPLVVNAYHIGTQRGNITMELPLPAVFIVYEPAWIVKYFLTAVEIYVSGMVAACFDAIFLSGTVHATALMRILRLLISNVSNVPTKQRVEFLHCCIKFHQKIYRFYLDIDSVYSKPSFVKFCCTMFINCMILFQISVALEEDVKMFFKMTVYLSAVGCAIVIYCFNGQKLTTESEKLPITWYECDWYNESPEFKKIIEMMIMRTNRAIHFNLAGFARMSLVTLMLIMRSSGSYFVILRNFHTEN